MGRRDSKNARAGARAYVEAGDPSTAAERLRVLARSLYLAPLVAANPATPPDLRAEIAARASAEAALRAAAADPATPARRLWTELSRHDRLLPLIAANPGAPPDLLGWLFHNRYDYTPKQRSRVRRILAANPNTPPEVLLELAPLFPDELFANPALPLLLLENPTWLHGLNPFALIMHPAAPPLVLASLTSYPEADIALEAALHVNLAGEAGPGWQRQVMDALWQLEEMPYYQEPLVMKLVEVGAVAPWLLPPLVLQGGTELRQLIAAVYGPHEPALAPFFRAGAAPDLCDYAAPDPTLESEVLEQLARGSAWAKGLVARHPSTPEDLRAQLADELAVTPGESVLPAGGNQASGAPASPRPAAPSSSEQWIPGIEQTLQALLESATRRYHLTGAIALAHPQVGRAQLKLLLREPVWLQRYAIARNPSTPCVYLKALARDVNSLVRAAAREELGRA